MFILQSHFVMSAFFTFFSVQSLILILLILKSDANIGKNL